MSTDPNPDGVSRYQFLEQLGEGGVAQVFRAVDRKLGRTVAVKVLKGSAQASDVARKRFFREAQVMAGLSHPNVVTVYDAGEENGRTYIAMELVEGQPMSRVFEDPARTLDERLRLLADASAGVAAAHAAGIVHRDLKPANILVTTGGTPKVGDFGLAHIMGSETGLTRSGVTIGTPLYMAPEQVEGHPDAITPRTDVYALGAMLYEVLTGRPPHLGDTVMELYGKIVHDDPVPPHGVDPKTPSDLETVALKALEKDPARRYADAREFAEEVRRFREGEPIQAKPLGALSRALRKFRRRPALRAAVAVTALAIVLALGGFAVQRHRLKQQVEELVRRAEAARAEGSFARARDLFGEAKTLSPGHAAAEAGFLEMAAKAGASERREAEALRHLGTLWAMIAERKRELRLLKIPADQAYRDLDDAVKKVTAYIDEWPESPQGYYVRARGRFYLGELEAAEEDIQLSLRKRPDFRPAWTLLGIVKVGLYESLLAGTQYEFLARAAKLNPILDAALAAFDKGPAAGSEREELERWGLVWVREDEVLSVMARALRTYYGDRAGEAARKLVEDALSKYRAEEYAYLKASFIPAGEERDKWYQQAVLWAPGYDRAWSAMGSEKLARKDDGGALSALHRAVEVGRTNGQAYQNRATARLRLGYPKGALEDSTRAIELSRRPVYALIGRSKAHMALGDPAAALRDCERAVELEPENAEVYLYRSVPRAKLGDLPGALKDCDAALERREDFADAYSQRGALKLDLGDLAGAIRDCDRALTLTDGNPGAYRTRGTARARQGKYAEALPDYDRAIAHGDTSEEMRLNRANLRYALGDLKGAIEEFERGISPKKQNATHYNLCGTAKARLGDLAGARRDFTQAIALQPDAYEAYYNRGLVHRELKEDPAAAKDLAEALRIAPANWPNRKNAETTLQDAQTRMKNKE